jgi:hypothetical protein
MHLALTIHAAPVSRATFRGEHALSHADELQSGAVSSGVCHSCFYFFRIMAALTFFGIFVLRFSRAASLTAALRSCSRRQSA